MADLIVLEGMPRTGKSTLTKLLVDKFGFITFDHEALKLNEDRSAHYTSGYYAGVNKATMIAMNALPTNTRIVLDRFVVSDMVARGDTTRELEEERMRLLPHRILNVLFEGSWSDYLHRGDARKRFTTRLDYFETEENYRFAFNTFCAKVPGSSLHINSSAPIKQIAYDIHNAYGRLILS